MRAVRHQNQTIHPPERAGGFFCGMVRMLLKDRKERMISERYGRQ